MDTSTHTKTKQRIYPAGTNDSDESILCVRFVLMPVWVLAVVLVCC